MANGAASAQLLFLLLAAVFAQGLAERGAAETCTDVPISCHGGKNNCTGDSAVLRVCTSSSPLQLDLGGGSAGKRLAKMKADTGVESLVAKSDPAADRAVSARAACVPFNAPAYMGTGEYYAGLADFRVYPNKYVAQYVIFTRDLYGTQFGIRLTSFYVLRTKYKCYLTSVKANRKGNKISLTGSVCC
eukprot:jgi/Mesen1/1255/ME000129S00347